jgi:branched-chain amino acid transport system permease protein
MAAVLAALYLVFQHTLTGKAMRAVAANRTAASLVGIPVRRVVLLSFAVSAGIGAIAGVILTPMTLMSFDRGTPFALKGFSAAVVGGLGNPVGAVLAGLFIGLIESYGTGLLSSHYKDVFALTILLIVLFLKPEGLFSLSSKRD